METYGGIGVGPVVVGVLTEQFSIVTAMQLSVVLAGGLVVVLGLTHVADMQALSSLQSE